MSKIEGSEAQGITDFLRESLDANHVLADWQVSLLEATTTRDRVGVERFMLKQMLFSTATEKIFLELTSTSPENPVTPARN